MHSHTFTLKAKEKQKHAMKLTTTAVWENGVAMLRLKLHATEITVERTISIFVYTQPVQMSAIFKMEPPSMEVHSKDLIPYICIES